jgi:hypothetical protein
MSHGVISPQHISSYHTSQVDHVLGTAILGCCMGFKGSRIGLGFWVHIRARLIMSLALPSEGAAWGLVQRVGV